MHGYLQVRVVCVLKYINNTHSSRWMFDCCRVPGDGLDWAVSHAKAGDKGDSGHIIVIRKNRFWKIDITDNGRILSTQELEKYVHVFCCRQRRLMVTGKYSIFMTIPSKNTPVLAF